MIITGLKVIAMIATEEVRCALQFCVALMQVPVAIAVLPGPEPTSAVALESPSAQEDTAPENALLEIESSH